MASNNVDVAATSIDLAAAPRGSESSHSRPNGIQGLDIRELLKACLPKNIDPEDRQQLEEYVKEENIKIRVMVTGPSGVGKSTLLNGLLGKTLFKVDRRSLDPVTTEVIDRTEDIGGITVIGIDSPGLHDQTPHEASYLQQMKEKVRAYGGIDLLLYCRKMDSLTSGRNVDYDTAIIEKLTANLGKEIWKNTLFVLTFANSYEMSLKQAGQDVSQKFDKRIRRWKRRIEAALYQCGVQCPVEVCPAGKCRLPLCGNQHWLSDVWASAVSATFRNESVTVSTLALVVLALTRGKYRNFSEAEPIAPIPSEAVSSTSELSPASSDSASQLENEPIVLTSKVKKVLGVIASGGAAAGAGAAIGATIGAVCIGVVSFGPAAGVGLLLGGAIGAAVGSAVSGAVLKLHGKRKAKKKQLLTDRQQNSEEGGTA